MTAGATPPSTDALTSSRWAPGGPREESAWRIRPLLGMPVAERSRVRPGGVDGA